MSSSTNNDSKVFTVVMIGTFDTKGEDFAYLYSCLVQKGVKIITINTGVRGTTRLFPVNVESEEVASAVSEQLSELRKNNDRGTALDVMGQGSANILHKMVKQGEVDGVISMGGGGGTYVALKAFQTVPFGIPKVCLSTLASKDLSEKVRHKDIVLMPSIVDITGLNIISRTLISQAAGALCGMMESKVNPDQQNQGSIAISVFGNTTICANSSTELLRNRGYDVLSFHAVGTGGKTMESLITEGIFSAVLDLTTTELADELCGGICSAGPNRLMAASLKGIPQVIVPGCVDMVNFGTLDEVPKKYKDRHLFSWAPDVTLMRTNEDENKVLGQLIAEKANVSKGPVIILLPTGGLSKLGGKGEVFHNPETDMVLFEAIKQHASSNLIIKEVNANINTHEFAKVAVDSLLKILN